MTTTRTGLHIIQRGVVAYDEGVRLQKVLVEDRVAERIPNTVILLEHPPTITLGRGAHQENVLLGVDALAARGITLHDTDRGGDVTYHGPGQLVGYPIISLRNRNRDVHKYLRDIEEMLIRVLARFGLEGERSQGATGVWVNDRKIAAIGVKVSRWVTCHGFSLNVATNLDGFSAIIPCGIRDRGVTSLSLELGRELTLSDAIPPVISELQNVFG